MPTVRRPPYAPTSISSRVTQSVRMLGDDDGATSKLDAVARIGALADLTHAVQLAVTVPLRR